MAPQNQTFTMLLRSPADVTELNKGSWFNLQRLIAVAAWLALLVVAAAVWLFLLRRKVRQQTGVIAASFRKEEALERRYLKLFQSATDIIFSVAPDGAIFRSNASAEAVFGPLAAPAPDGPLALNLLDRVRRSTRQPTQLWLHRAFAERSAGPFDLYVINAHGGESVLEVSASIVEAGDAGTMECIARDVTQRKMQQQLEADRNRVLELVARRSPLEEILPVVENLLDRQIPHACCSIVATLPELGLDKLPDPLPPRKDEPDACRSGLRGREGRERLEITASDNTRLGWLCYSKGDSGAANAAPVEADKKAVLETAVNLAAVAIEHDLLNRKLIHQSQHDALTGPSQRLLFQREPGPGPAQGAPRGQGAGRDVPRSRPVQVRQRRQLGQVTPATCSLVEIEVHHGRLPALAAGPQQVLGQAVLEEQPVKKAWSGRRAGTGGSACG